MAHTIHNRPTRIALQSMVATREGCHMTLDATRQTTIEPTTRTPPIHATIPDFRFLHLTKSHWHVFRGKSFSLALQSIVLGEFLPQ